jgi:hypothetical protein
MVFACCGTLQIGIRASFLKIRCLGGVVQRTLQACPTQIIFSMDMKMLHKIIQIVL